MTVSFAAQYVAAFARAPLAICAVWVMVPGPATDTLVLTAPAALTVGVVVRTAAGEVVAEAPAVDAASRSGAGGAMYVSVTSLPSPPT